MSDRVALDLFIQDFVKTNKLLNQTQTWESLVSRSKDGTPRLYQFTSGGSSHLAIGQLLQLPDALWYRIELRCPIPVADHRFDICRLMSALTHTELTTEEVDNTFLVKLITRHPGCVNVVFVFRNPEEGIPSHPMLR
jgi:hypothetical protein